MRTRERQRIYRRFMRGESVTRLAGAYIDRDGVYNGNPLQIESIIREGTAKGWDSGKRWML